MSLRFASSKILSSSSRFVRPTVTAAMPDSFLGAISFGNNNYDKGQSPPRSYGGSSKRSFSSTSASGKIMKVPSKERAEAMRAKLSEMENDTLLTIAHMGNHQAGVEVLKRHIMVVDGVDYDEACKTFSVIEEANQRDLFGVLPYFVGIGVTGFAALYSIPMVFDLGTATWFNAGYVTTEVPPPEDLETALEVGSWTWNWMEPPLGTLSFALLCLQFARAQIQNLGMHPYTQMLVQRRAAKLADKFPQYDRELMFLYSESEPLVNNMYGN